MKKIAKMSLIAAVAVAGLSSVASAGALEEAIKNVDVSGGVAYRYDDYNSKTGMNTNRNKYHVVTAIKSKVNDDVAANLVLNMGNNPSGPVTLDTRAGGGDATVSLSQANFVYTGLDNVTVIAGKQALGTPWTTTGGLMATAQTGTGALALATLGPVTAGAGYFNQTNLQTTGASAAPLKKLGYTTTGGEDIVVATLMGNFSGIALDAWYLDKKDVYDSYTIGAKGNIDLGGATIKAGARYASLNPDFAGVEDQTFYKVTLGGKVGMVGANFAYGATDKDGGLTAEDTGAETTMEGWNTTILGKTDAKMYKINLNADVLPNLNFALNYNNVKDGADVEDQEAYGQLTYKMSKNFTTYVRYGQAKMESKGSTEKDNVGRLQVAYTF